MFIGLYLFFNARYGFYDFYAIPTTKTLLLRYRTVIELRELYINLFSSQKNRRSYVYSVRACNASNLPVNHNRNIHAALLCWRLVVIVRFPLRPVFNFVFSVFYTINNNIQVVSSITPKEKQTRTNRIFLIILKLGRDFLQYIFKMRSFRFSVHINIYF